MSPAERFNRRTALARLGLVSAGTLLAACGDDKRSATTQVTTTQGSTATVQPRTPASGSLASRFDDAATCRETAELTEGPFYIDVEKVRTDIREDREGTLLRLGVRVRDAASCEAIDNAAVDIWHCDAGGTYSGFEAGGGGAAPAPDARFLRGTQVTNEEGIAQFRTIYPGWYPGRTVHIHAKVLLDRQSALTTQFFFDEAVTRKVLQADPYAGDEGRDVFNDGDGIYRKDLELTLSEEEDGWLGLITVDVA